MRGGKNGENNHPTRPPVCLLRELRLSADELRKKKKKNRMSGEKKSSCHSINDIINKVKKTEENNDSNVHTTPLQSRCKTKRQKMVEVAVNGHFITTLLQQECS